MPQLPGSQGASQTSGQVPVLTWMYESITQVFGQNGEKGNDFGMPWGYPVGSPITGQIVNIDSSNVNNSIGYIVQIASGNYVETWHIQHLMTVPTGLHVGQMVTAGDVIGYSGGCAGPNGYGNNPNVCSATDQYTTGPHIEVRIAKGWNPNAGTWGQNWIDPYNQIQSLAAGYKNTYIISKSANTITPGTNPPLDPNIDTGTPNPLGDCQAQYAIDHNVINLSLCMVKTTIVSWGEHIAIFVIALVLIIVGFILMKGNNQSGQQPVKVKHVPVPV